MSYNSVGDTASYCTDNSNSLFNNSEKTVFDRDDLEDGYSTSSSNDNSNSPTIPTSSSSSSNDNNSSSNGGGGRRSLFKEDTIKAVFDVLDANKDGAIHKEEFIAAMTDVYKLFLTAYGHYNAELPSDSHPPGNRRRNLRRRGFAFAYSCMTARELAVTTAVRCYGAVSQALASTTPLSAPSSRPSNERGGGLGSYFLSYEDLYAWYLFGGSEPLRDLMIHAMDFFIERRQLGFGLGSSSTDQGKGKGQVGNRTLHRNKSVVSLLSNNNNSNNNNNSRVVARLGQAGLGLVLWPSLEEFVLRCQQQLSLSSPGSASYLHHLLLMASSSSSPLSSSFSSSSSSSSPSSSNHRALLQCNQPITKEKYLKTFISFLNINGTSQGLSSLLDAIFDICSMDIHITSSSSSSSSSSSNDSKSKAPVCNLLSLLTILCDSPSSYLQNYQSLFDAYKLQRGNRGGHQGQEDTVSDVLLYKHLSQVFRLAFYFNPTFSCSPDDLAHAIASKYLALTEIDRKEKDNLNFDEFLELLTQSVRLGLRMLQMKSGFIVDSITALVGWKTISSEEEGNLTLQTESSVEYNDPNNKLLMLSSPSLNAVGSGAMLHSSSSDSSDVSPVEYYEDSQMASFFIEYCGDEVRGSSSSLSIHIDILILIVMMLG